MNNAYQQMLTINFQIITLWWIWLQTSSHRAAEVSRLICANSQYKQHCVT